MLNNPKDSYEAAKKEWLDQHYKYDALKVNRNHAEYGMDFGRAYSDKQHETEIKNLLNMNENQAKQLFDRRVQSRDAIIATLEKALEKYENIVSEYRSGGDEWAAKEALTALKEWKEGTIRE